MFNDFEVYFYENIITPYIEYLNKKKESKFGRNKSLKSGLISAVNLYHLQEHLPNSISITKKDIGISCPSYKILGNVANLTKHHHLNKDNPVISNAEQIFERLVIILFEDKKGVYSDHDKVIVVKLDDGTELYLHNILYEVLKFWIKYLNSEKKIVKRYNIIKPQGYKFKKRENCSQLDMEMVQGLNFDLPLQILKYNKISHKIEPFDLTNTELQFRVYKPYKKECILTVVDDLTGNSIEETLFLSEKDSIEFDRLKTDKERQEFIENLDYVKDKYLEMLAKRTVPKNDQ